jgi:hypothetical protein
MTWQLDDGRGLSPKYYLIHLMIRKNRMFHGLGQRSGAEVEVGYFQSHMPGSTTV